MKLTKEEEQIILRYRAEQDGRKPKKEGFLKTDLYTYEYGEDWERDTQFWLYTEKELEIARKEFENSFKRVLKKGTRFICFINESGTESWFDDVNYGVEGQDKAWAKLYLTNIRDIK